MSRPGKIKGLASLEKEIYRLEQDSRKVENKLEKNFDQLLEDLPSLFMGLFFRKRSDKKNNGPGFSKSKPDFGSIFERMADHISQKAVDGVGSLISRLFSKQK